MATTETENKKGQNGSEKLSGSAPIATSDVTKNQSPTYLRDFDNRSNMRRRSGPAEHETKEGPLYKVFLSSLKDMYYAEKKLMEALEKLADAATTPELKDSFQEHRSVTERQRQRLERVFRMLEEEPAEEKCEAIDGIIKEGEQVIKDTEEGTMSRDAALIIAAQKAEHYEIASYGGLVALAQTLGVHRVADLLQTTLDEEYDADDTLTDIAESEINFEAAEEDEDEEDFDWEDEEEEE